MAHEVQNAIAAIRESMNESTPEGAALRMEEAKVHALLAVAEAIRAAGSWSA